jgi:hypothetical protein
MIFISVIFCISLNAQHYQATIITQVPSKYDNNFPKDIVMTFTYAGVESIKAYLAFTLQGEGIVVNSSMNPSHRKLFDLNPGITNVNSTNYNMFINVEYLEITGGTQQDIMNLPEGSWSFCPVLYDNRNNLPLSDPEQGCYNFSTLYVLPPNISFDCGKAITMLVPQQKIDLNWSAEPGAPVTALNKVFVKKVPLGMSPVDAWNSPGIPVIYEKTVSLNFYSLSMTDLVDLTPGTQYVFAVQCTDPNNTVTIQNNGWSVPCYFTIGTGDSLYHSAEVSKNWPSAHVLPASPIIVPPGHDVKKSKELHAEEISKTWPKDHKYENSKTWPEPHDPDVSKAWPANHTGPYSLTWKDHAADKSPTWPPDHHGERSITWLNHKAEPSKTWPANHTGSTSDTWKDHKPDVSKNWPANHDGEISKNWRDHKPDVSKNWPANHIKDNSQNWKKNLGHTVAMSPQWPANHEVNYSKKWIGHDPKISPTWKANHKMKESNNK